jgi:hypothetical protein
MLTVLGRPHQQAIAGSRCLRLECMCGLDLVTPDMRGVLVGPEGQICQLVAETDDEPPHAADRIRSCGHS